MDIGISTVKQVFKTYQGQVRIAELNSKNPVKRSQGQRDLVSISSEAKAALTKHAMQHILKQLRSSQAVKAEKISSENLTAQTDRLETGENEKTLSEELPESSA